MVIHSVIPLQSSQPELLHEWGKTLAALRIGMRRGVSLEQIVSRLLLLVKAGRLSQLKIRRTSSASLAQHFQQPHQHVDVVIGVSESAVWGVDIGSERVINMLQHDYFSFCESVECSQKCGVLPGCPAPVVSTTFR